MSNAAPGQSTSQSQDECYNCGARGHWVIACPEATREVPAGLQRQRASKQSQDKYSRSDKNNSSHDRRGPVVTRYPLPPPPASQPLSGYGQPVPAPYPSGAASGLPHPPAIPPPPPPTQAQGYQQPTYPTAPFNGGYPVQPAPPGYGQFAGHVPVPAPQYGQPQAYGQPQYGAPYHPPANYYQGGVPQHPPPAFAGNAYPQQYGPAPQPPPPGAVPYSAQPPYPSQPLPPHADYQYPQVPHSSHVPVPPGHSFQPPPPGWNPATFGPPPGHASGPRQPPNNHNHRGKKNHGNKRNRDRNRDRNSHENQARGGDNQKKQHHDQQPRDRQQHQDAKQSRQKNQQDQQKEATAGDQPEKQLLKKKDGEKSGPKKDKEKKDDGEFDYGSEKDLKLVFPEIEVHPADPVGIPLPFEYTEDPTIPPAYNATCVKSSYFNEYDLTEFVRPIRDSQAWPTLKDDPAFQMYPGMITRTFPPDQHEYPTYERVAPPSPSATIKMPPRYNVDRAVLEQRLQQKLAAAEQAQRSDTPRRDGHAPRASSAGYRGRRQESSRDRRDWDRSYDNNKRATKRSYEDENDRDSSRDFKRARRADSRDRSPDYLRNRGTSPTRRWSRSPLRRRRSPSPGFNIDTDPWAPQAGETSLYTPVSGRRIDVRSSTPREDRAPPNRRNDSGYHSGHSLEKGPSQSVYRDGGERSPYRRRSRSRSNTRSDRGRSPSRTLDRSYSQVSSSSGRGRTRTRSPSPLTAMEADLLGMADTDDAAEKKRKIMAKKPVKRPQVAAAYRNRSPPGDERARERSYSPLTQLERDLLGLADSSSSESESDKENEEEQIAVMVSKKEPVKKPIEQNNKQNSKRKPLQEKRKNPPAKRANGSVQTKSKRRSKPEPEPEPMPSVFEKRKKETARKKPANRSKVPAAFASRRW